AVAGLRSRRPAATRRATPMRALWAVSLVAVMSLVLTPGGASAGPGQSSWDSGIGVVLDQCTGEYFDNTFNAHIVETDSGYFHFNVHVEGIGQTSGSRYVGNNVSSEFFHALPDSTFMIDQVLNVR